ncbi:MAG: pyridoxine 5'-phosphate synthase [Alphaproteobacteria bacterium]|nr:pyridoxine 5'-phosphate synthase [Alphaproteobacteria bacterium]
MAGHSPRLRLGVNIDHVATLRNARGGAHPDPLRAAQLALAAGADGITAHLREDRRHIDDRDLAALIDAKIPVNLEMAATDEMLKIALASRPAWCCLVPEHREERTTEGGLNVVGNANWLKTVVASLKRARISVSLFIEPDPRQIEAARDLGAEAVELHTGAWSNAVEGGNRDESGRLLAALQNAAREASRAGIEVHAGHGLGFANAGPVAAIPEIVELQIGHFLIGEAVFSGLEATIRQMRKLMDDSR